MNKRQSHTNCVHPNDKASRAACRRKRLNESTERVVTHTFQRVLNARNKGYAAQIKLVTFYQVAQEYGVDTFDEELAKKLSREKAEQMGDIELLAPEARPEMEIK